MEILGLLFLVNLFLSFIAGWIAKSKGRSAAGFFFFSFFLSFLLAVIVLIAVPTVKPTDSSQLRSCPFCAEKIQNAAVVCKHCGKDVEPIQALPIISEAQKAADYKSNKWLLWGAILTVGSILMLAAWWQGTSDPTIPVWSRILALVIELSILALGIVFVVKGNIQAGKDNEH